MNPVDLPPYLEMLPAPLLAVLDAAAEPVPGVPGLRLAPGLQAEHPLTENAVVLGLVCEVYRAVLPELRRILEQRTIDRAFIDRSTLGCVQRNQGRSVQDPDYETVVGKRDPAGRVVIGPADQPPTLLQVEVPEFLQGDQITLFGPPDSARLSINAMNAIHRQRPHEDPFVAELVEQSGLVPRWGADSEDSKTPLASSLLQATENLASCFDGSLRFEDPRTGRIYALAETGRSLPIKRVPGLALPDGNRLLDGNPLPFHLVELVSHVWLHRDRPEALIFYVPKLENEEEAAYFATLVRETEAAVAARHPAGVAGAVRLMIVFENPRAIFRIREMAHALHPWFLGGSLGWHDYLASTARLFQHDPAYRIPVKADPNIVIRNIKESHLILARALGPMGALKLGGMYGVLFQEDDPASFVVSMVGYVRDVVTQLRRGLDGFWVAHPDFVRIGIALVTAWRRQAGDPVDDALDRLVRILVPDPVEQAVLLGFVHSEDVPGLDEADPRYPRAVLAADLEGSPLIANDDPEEVRYNLFQALQYLADWLSGNGCVALPATLTDARGNAVHVRIMDDLATTERSRWELWAELHHGRVTLELFEQLLAQEVAFLQAGVDTETKRIQVRWEGEAARWYPLAVRLLRQLATDPTPPEWVPQLLLPFTHAPIREAADPWAAAQALCPGRYRT